MNNFYLIDKPLEYSSFDIIRVLRKKLNIRKMWHTWTLDPLATGGLLIATWNYTKLIPYFEKDKKTYEFTINLDGVTESFDLAEKIHFLDKELQEKYKKELSKEKIDEILKKDFTWKIKQLPPKYSALKINWKKACDLMREWKDVELKIREITIYKISILDYNYPSLRLIAEVSAWTYIRSIASELWEILWTWWYITNLRRTKIGDLDISLWNDIDSLDDIKALKIEKLFQNRKFIILEDDILIKINNWLKVKWNFDYSLNEDLFVHDKWIVTNIVRYDWNILYAVRKI
jgi:tRNA pseudouridine55 synthase